jgi:hypothetical protein
MTRTFIATIAVLLLGACDGSSIVSGPPPKADATPNPMEAKIDALSPALQQITMFRAIQDGNFTCQKIVQMKKRTPTVGKAIWDAECEDQGRYVIELQPDGIFWVSGVPQPKKQF